MEYSCVKGFGSRDCASALRPIANVRFDHVLTRAIQTSRTNTYSCVKGFGSRDCASALQPIANVRFDHVLTRAIQTSRTTYIHVSKGLGLGTAQVLSSPLQMFVLTMF